MNPLNIDLTKVQQTSLANSFKNDGKLYTGTIVGPATIPAASFNKSQQSFQVDTAPQFTELYAYFQENFDLQQQFFIGSGFEGPHWYHSSINTKVGVLVTGPVGFEGPLDAIIYPEIVGTTVTVTLLINNPYAVDIFFGAINIPWRFLVYSLTN